MDKDRIKGGAREVKGSVKEGFGKVTGDKQTEAVGNIEKNLGKAQKKVGEAKDKAREVLKR
ncbi:MAG TPA: CsbD family protein [Nevskiaceae bacterium]